MTNTKTEIDVNFLLILVVLIQKFSPYQNSTRMGLRMGNGISPCFLAF